MPSEAHLQETAQLRGFFVKGPFDLQSTRGAWQQNGNARASRLRELNARACNTTRPAVKPSQVFQQRMECVGGEGPATRRSPEPGV